jgi:hypothetical protein
MRVNFLAGAGHRRRRGAAMKNLIPLGAVNLLLVSVYLVPVWMKDALRVLNSPFGGLHDRSHAAAVGLIREFLGLGIDGMLVVSQVLAGLKLLVVAAMVAFYIDVIRAVAERREPDRATIDTALTLAFISVLILAPSALMINDHELARTVATQIMLLCGPIIVTMFERDAERRARSAQSSVPVSHQQPVAYEEPAEQRLAA